MNEWTVYVIMLYKVYLFSVKLCDKMIAYELENLGSKC